LETYYILSKNRGLFVLFFTSEIELRYFELDSPEDLLFTLSDDSFIQVNFEYQPIFSIKTSLKLKLT